jgi:hypothetical protein
MMSRSSAIAAVTQTLATLLEAALQTEDASYTVSILPPDKANAETQQPNRLNLFLFQVCHNPAWRNMSLPGRTLGGEAGQPPLALVLSYMLTAYGDGGPEAKDHRILGLAMQFLNDNVLLMAHDIRAAFPGSGLEDQVDRVRITPRVLNLEELVRMWGTFMTQYRISTAYDVSVVLIDSTDVPAPAPVLRRGSQDQGVLSEASLPPLLIRVVPPELLRRNGQIITQPAATLGQTLTLIGDRLAPDDMLLQVRNPAWEPRWAGLGVAASTLPGALQAVLADPPPEPDAPAGVARLAWTPGVYMAALLLRRPGLPDVLSNAVPFALAPVVTLSPTSAPPGAVDVTIGCLPPTRAGQVVLLVLPGEQARTPATITQPSRTGQPAQLSFHYPALTTGRYPVRLRVDGVDSLPFHVAASGQLEFDPAQTLVIA